MGAGGGELPALCPTSRLWGEDPIQRSIQVPAEGKPREEALRRAGPGAGKGRIAAETWECSSEAEKAKGRLQGSSDFSVWKWVAAGKRRGIKKM